MTEAYTIRPEDQESSGRSLCIPCIAENFSSYAYSARAEIVAEGFAKDLIGMYVTLPTGYVAHFEQYMQLVDVRMYIGMVQTFREGSVRFLDTNGSIMGVYSVGQFEGTDMCPSHIVWCALQARKSGRHSWIRT